MLRTSAVPILLLFGISCLALPYEGTSESGQGPTPGLIASDRGGAPGYQHGMKQSHFVIGAQSRVVNEFGWAKIRGSNGTFATSLRNGVVVAVPNARREKDGPINYRMTPNAHNQSVLEYFTNAGLPADQLGGIQATTRLSSRGHTGELRAATPQIDAYVSLVERKVEGIPVPDSVAWAEMNDKGEVVSEGVYWPSIPAKALEDARRLQKLLTRSSDRSQFLSHLPAELPPGRVVIRHSSASVQDGTFEAFASYDVVVRKESGNNAAEGTASKLVSSVVKHFDVEGVERRLPQEKPIVKPEYQNVKKVPPAYKQ